MKKVFLTCASALVLSSCMTVGSDYEGASTVPVPDRWEQASSQNEVTPQDLNLWWKKFNDPVLDSLIQRASRNNLDLRIMLSRIDEARAQHNVTASQYYPSFNAKAAQSREHSSESATEMPTNTDVRHQG